MHTTGVVYLLVSLETIRASPRYLLGLCFSLCSHYIVALRSKCLIFLLLLLFRW